MFYIPFGQSSLLSRQGLLVMEICVLCAAEHTRSVATQPSLAASLAAGPTSAVASDHVRLCARPAGLAASLAAAA